MTKNNVPAINPTDIQTGEKIIVLEDHSSQGRLTPGKTYEVISVQNTRPRIISDWGDNWNLNLVDFTLPNGKKGKKDMFCRATKDAMIYAYQSLEQKITQDLQTLKKKIDFISRFKSKDDYISTLITEELKESNFLSENVKEEDVKELVQDIITTTPLDEFPDVVEQ